MALKIKANKRTLVRGYFLDTINLLNNKINEEANDRRNSPSERVESVLRLIKDTLNKEIDQLTNDIEES